MKHIIICHADESAGSLYTSIRDFSTEKVILLSPEARLRIAGRIKEDLARFKVPVKILELKGNIWESTFRAIFNIMKVEGSEKLLINVSMGDNISRLAITSSAFVNGIKAFACEEDAITFLPVLKFSYYKILTEKKMEIIRTLNKRDCCSSLEELSKKTGMSLPLVSYHINGTLKSEGLKKLGLVETVESRGKTAVSLTTQGKLLVDGFI